MRIRILIAATCALLVALAPAGQARGASNPPPPKSLETPGIDAHFGYKPQKSCTPAAKPGTTALLKALLKNWGGKSWGISRFCTSGGTSEHKEGRALDWHMDSRKAKDRAKVDQAIKWITANNGEVAYRLGIMYIIWNQKIWSIYYQELGWRKMASRGSWTANHKDHVHISLSWDGAMAQTSWWTGKVLQVPRPGACGAGSNGPCLAMIGRSSSTGWPKVQVGPFLPYPSAVPAIGGSARVGLTLTAVAGTWTPPGATLSYQWLRGSSAIAGATAERYQVGAADIGKAIKVKVSATLEGTTVTKTSDSTTDTVPGVFPTPRPAVTGDHEFDATLTGAPGGGFPDGTAFAYQWQRGSTNIAGATSADYRLTAMDVGHDVRLRVRASRTGYTSSYSYSVSRKVKPKQFSTAPKPALSGIVRVGGVLKVASGDWDPTAALSYQWYRSGKAIKGATKAGYTLGKADLGRQVHVRARGTLAGYASTDTYSERTAKVQAGLTAATPKISDSTPRVGQVLTAGPGAWKPSGVGFGYQWYRDGKAIAGADQRSYPVTAADYGKKLQVQVTGSLEDYPDLAKRSAKTGKVAAGQFRAGTVTVTGTPSVAETLTADEGTWTSKNDPDLELTPAFGYQWYAAGKSIKGATGRTLVVGAALAGKQVHVVVTAKASRYGTAKASAKPVTIGR
jgi:hypothetical protein